MTWQNRIVGSGQETPDQLLANPANWRIHPRYQQEALAGVLDEVGWVQDVIVNRTTGHLLDGHLRVTLALRRDEPSIPVKYVELSEAEEALILATLDPISALAMADASKLDALLKEARTDSPAIRQLLDGLAHDAGLMRDDGAMADAEPQIDRAEELNRKWQVKTGDLWRIGEHRLLCGDSTRREDVERVMGEERAELLFTSPPYADIRTYQGGDLSPEHLSMFIPIWEKFVNFLVVNLGIKRIKDEVFEYWNNYIRAAQKCGLKLLCWNVWDKMLAGSISNQSAMFAIEHEWLFVFGQSPKSINRTVIKTPDSEKRLKYNRHDTSGRMVRAVRQADGTMKDSVKGENYPYKNMPSVIQVFPEMARDVTSEHVAVFPLSLVSIHVETMTDRDHGVADPFLGSGTTMVACQNLNRRCRAIEISPAYCAVALQRMADAFPGIEIDRI